MAKFYLERTKKIVEVPDSQIAEYQRRRGYTLLPDAPNVPDGSVSEVLAWVGDDPNRRLAALEAEREGRGRVTLIAALEA